MKLTFDNQFADLGDIFSVKMKARPLPNARMASINLAAAALLDLDSGDLHGEDALKFFSGAGLIEGADPLAMVYSGHQFGGYNPRLGDGRGLLLGQVCNKQGVLWDLHLKGAGPTPFSRGADGRAVLRSSIREYLASEALHHLGIPTSRALCIISSDEPVQREKLEKAAGLIRLSQSHIRFGSFEYFYYTGQHEALKKLADYVIDVHFPDIRHDPAPYDRMLLDIVAKTAHMIAQWQAFGFAHGVMNTDNMSIIGQTFDYGPYGFMEAFDPNYICNHSDDRGRYAFNEQPNIGLWNCFALAHALTPLLSAGLSDHGPDHGPDHIKDHYQTQYFKHYDLLMNQKIGLSRRMDGDQDLINRFLSLLATHKIDYTLFLREFSESLTAPKILKDNTQAFDEWLSIYRIRWKQEGVSLEQRRRNMQAVNPKYILRNYLAQNAIAQAEKGEFSEVDRLLELLRKPFDDQPNFSDYAKEPPQWGRCLEISCSS